MTGAVLGLDIRRSRSALIWLGLIAFAYAAVMALVYPTMRDNMAAIEEYLKIFPKEFMVAFGLSGSLGDPGVFFNMYLGSMIWPIVAAILGVLVATRPVAADLDRGFLELMLTTPLPRRRYLALSIVGQIVVITVVAALTVLGLLVAGAIVGAGFEWAPFLATIPLLAAFGCSIAAFATLLSVASLSRGVAGGVTVAVVLAMYLANVVAQLVREVDWLARLSAFHYLDTKSVIDGGPLPLPEIGLFVAFAAAFWLAAIWLFGRRDLAA